MPLFKLDNTEITFYLSADFIIYIGNSTLDFMIMVTVAFVMETIQKISNLGYHIPIMLFFSIFLLWDFGPCSPTIAVYGPVLCPDIVSHNTHLRNIVDLTRVTNITKI